MHPTYNKNINLISDSHYLTIYNNQTLIPNCDEYENIPISHSHSSTHKAKNEKSGNKNTSMKVKKSNGKQPQKVSPFLHFEYQSENKAKKKESLQNNSIHKSMKNKKQKAQKNIVGKQQNSYTQQRKEGKKQQKIKFPGGQINKKEGSPMYNRSSKTKRKQKSRGQQQTITMKTIKNRQKNTNRGQVGTVQGQTKLIIDLTTKKEKQGNKRTTNRLNSKSSHCNPKINNHNGVSKLVQLPSTREYCVIRGKFIPLQFSTDRKRLDNIFLQTATTSPDVSHKRFLNQIQTQSQYHNHSQVVQRDLNTNYISKTSSSAHADIGVETIKKQLANYQVLVKAAQQDVGIQYSDRLNLSGRKYLQIQKQVKQKVKLRLEQIQKSNNLTEPEKSQRSVLLDTMMKLQALQLNQNFPLDKLNKEQKKHFREIFSSLMLKMKSPRSSDLPPNFSRNCDQLLQIQNLKKVKQKQGNQQQKNDELQHALMMRQSRQINQLNIFMIKSHQQVDTSLLSVLSTFADIFCYVQMNHEDSVIKSMNNLYGLSYTDKFLTISKFYRQNKRSDDKGNFPVSSRLKLQILNQQYMQKTIPDSVFHSFILEIESQIPDELSQDEKKISPSKIVVMKQSQRQQSYRQIHAKGIFDCINQLLTPYRPFYSTKGDPFPWTMSPLKCLTFYSIDSQSLQTVVQQIQQKMIKILKSLCGLHIEPSMYVAKDYQQKQQSKKWQQDRVFCIRRERLSRCIIEECQTQASGQGEQYLELQIDTTCILYELSLMISQQLFQQLSCEIGSMHRPHS